MNSPSPMKRLRLRWSDHCVRCGCELPAGTEAIWDRTRRTVTCLACGVEHVRVTVGIAGASARREHERQRARRERYARDRLGQLGVLLARVIPEPQRTRAWRDGAEGEERTAARLEKHLHGHPVRLLQDRRIPDHGQANIDHIAVGPGGVTVIDTKWRKGDVQGALCFPRVDGLPLFRRQYIRGVLIDGPKRAAQLARRTGEHDPQQVERIWRALGQRFPEA